MIVAFYESFIYEPYIKNRLYSPLSFLTHLVLLFKIQARQVT